MNRRPVRGVNTFKFILDLGYGRLFHLWLWGVWFWCWGGGLRSPIPVTVTVKLGLIWYFDTVYVVNMKSWEAIYTLTGGYILAMRYIHYWVFMTNYNTMWFDRCLEKGKKRWRRSMPRMNLNSGYTSRCNTSLTHFGGVMSKYFTKCESPNNRNQESYTESTVNYYQQ